MDRRAFLLSAVATAGAGLAGCSEMLDESADGSSADEEEDDDETDDDGTPTEDDTWQAPTWAEWIPAEILADGSNAELGALDIDGTRSFPGFDIGEPYRELLGLFGVEESAGNRAGVVLNEASDPPGVITGSFDPDAILSHIRSESDESISTQEYRGVTIVDDFVGLDSSALVFGETKRRLIDTRYGESPSSVATSEVFQRVYPPLSDGAFAALTDGYYDPPFEYSVDASGVSVESLTRERATLTAAWLFESETEAETFVDESGETLGEDGSTVTVQSLDRTEAFVTATFETTDTGEFVPDDGTTV